MEAVWHAMEYFGNTILFVLCGLFAYESCKKVAWADFAWLILLYILATMARALMVAVLWPVVNMVGGSDVTLLGGTPVFWRTLTKSQNHAMCS